MKEECPGNFLPLPAPITAGSDELLPHARIPIYYAERERERLISELERVSFSVQSVIAHLLLRVLLAADVHSKFNLWKPLKL